MSAGVDFDFARYIAERRGQVHQRARDGAAYAFSGELRLRRTLASARPVAMAIEGATRTWKSAAKGELLESSIKATDQQFPQLYSACRRACLTLHLEQSTRIYVAPASSRVKAQALGTEDDTCIVINAALVERLSETEILAVLGGELGHIQNNHIVYTTALYYLTQSAGAFVRWIVKPATVALKAWARRAQITCDRAALLTCGDLDATLAAITKTSLALDGDEEIDIEAYLAQLPDSTRGIAKYGELFRSDPYLRKRVEALRLFARSHFYRTYTGHSDDTDEGATGLSAHEVDAKVAEILSVF